MRHKTVVRTGAILLAASTLALAGCADMQPNGPGPVTGAPYGYAPPPPARPMEGGFNPQEFAWSVNGGPGEIAAHVAYRSVSGERWTCSGQVIALIPATHYSAERMQVLYGSQARAVVPAVEVRNRNAARPGIDYGRYVRTATCDARDAMGFARLPIGPYFLIARARPRGHNAGPNDGVVIMQRLDVGPGLTHVILPTP
ncbi:hypothetical protein [Caulobacter sp. S45]|uniref:hypothetical protein n=1 Tax=Caulobacter sp. S45 TaxID=1641861 RepID=UPI001576134D|nr:hypothetical protein [Caulobacter sp. S45]